MIKNPFDEARQEELKEKSEEFLKQFSINYGLNYVSCLFDKLVADAEGKNKDLRRLTYRSWGAIQRPDMFRGEAFMKTGMGQGDFGSWKKYYFVERKDYNIDYYKDEKTFDKKPDKPAGTIRLAGYSLETDCRRFYQQKWDELKAAMGASGEPTDPVGYSRFSWSLAHPNRMNYIFQLHEGKNPTCGCFGGGAVEPDDVGADKEGERSQWLEVMNRCLDKVKGYNRRIVGGQAFAATVKDLKSEFEALSSYQGDGAESQILVDLLVLHVVNPIKDGMLADLQAGPFSIRVKMGFTIAGTVQTILEKMIDPVWSKCQDATNAVAAKVDSALKPAMAKAVEVKNKIQTKIQEKFLVKLGGLLQKYVSPTLSKAVNEMEKPLKNGFASVTVTFQQQTSGVGGDIRQINIMLDAVPRKKANVKDIVDSAHALVKPFEEMKNAFPDILSHVNVNKLKTDAEKTMLKTLDAAINTLEKLIKEKGLQDLDAHKQIVLRDLEYDVQVARNHFVKMTIREIFIEGVKEKFFEEVPGLDDLASIIPEELAEFINLKGMLSGVIDFFVGGPVDQMVDGIIPLPEEALSATAAHGD